MMTSLRPHWESLVSKGNHPQMALVQASELLQFTQNADLLKALSLKMSFPVKDGVVP